MFRSKILGQDSFNQAMVVTPVNVNSDMGHFSIGGFDLIAPVFEDVPMPPKHLWIRVKIHFELCPDTPVFHGGHSFVWPGDGRCASVKLEGSQILYAQKDYEIDKCWTLSKEQKIYEHCFAVAPTLYGNDTGIHLWPCGGRVGKFLEIEQLFAQVAFDENDIFVNSLSTWKKHFDLIAPVFEDVPMPPKHLWIRVKIHFELCPDTPVFHGGHSFVWPGDGRCASVKLEGSQILYAQKDYEIDKCWTLSKEQKIYEHCFAVAPTLYGNDTGIHLWPCGGRVGKFLEIEQLFAQVAFDENDIFVNSLSTWKKHLVDGDEVVFEPPPANEISLANYSH